MTANLPFPQTGRRVDAAISLVMKETSNRRWRFSPSRIPREGASGCVMATWCAEPTTAPRLRGTSWEVSLSTIPYTNKSILLRRFLHIFTFITHTAFALHFAHHSALHPDPDRKRRSVTDDPPRQKGGTRDSYGSVR